MMRTLILSANDDAANDDAGRRTFTSWSALKMICAHPLRGLLHLKDNNWDHI